MTTHDHKAFVERIKRCLRAKREKKEVHPICTLEEIFKTLSLEERTMFHEYQLPDFLNVTFAAEMRNNTKIHFDVGRKQFSFKNNFSDENNLVEKLYGHKMGVVENQDLYDDIDKDNLEKLKQEGLLRVITIKEKKDPRAANPPLRPARGRRGRADEARGQGAQRPQRPVGDDRPRRG